MVVETEDGPPPNSMEVSQCQTKDIRIEASTSGEPRENALEQHRDLKIQQREHFSDRIEGMPDTMAHDLERTREMMFLMVHALHGIDGMEDMGAVLSEKAMERGLLPQRTDYRGQEWNEGYRDVEKRFGHIPTHALMDAMGLLQTRFPNWFHGRVSFLDRGILDDTNVLYRKELEQAPPLMLRSLPSRHYGNDKGESVFVYTQLLRETGYQVECRDGIGLGLTPRHQWKHQFTTRGHSLAAYCVVYNRSGDLIITGSDDRLAKIWSARTGLLLCSCRGHLQEVSDLTVSHDNKVLASASVDGAIRLWNIDMDAMGTDAFGSLLGTLQGHTELVSALNFSPIRHYELLSSSFDGTCRVWDIRDGSCVTLEWNWQNRRRDQGNTIQLRRRDEQQMEEGRQRRTQRHQNIQQDVDILDAGEGEHEQEEDDCKVSTALFSSDGRHIIAGIANSNICVWEWHAAKDGEDARASRVELLRDKHSSDVYLLQMSHSGQWIASASRDGVVCIWMPGKGGHHRRLVPIDTWKIYSYFRAPDPVEDVRRRRKGPSPRVDQVVWNADDSLVLASVQNFKVIVYSLRNKNIVSVLGGIHEEPVHVVLSHPYDPRIAMTASYSGEIVVWDILEGTKLKIFHSVDSRPDGRKWPDPIAYVDGFMSPDGQCAAFADAAGQLHVVGIGTPPTWLSKTPYDQFLSNDYEDLITDDQGVVRSVETGQPADVSAATAVLCDATATPYPQGFQVAYRQRNLLSSPWSDVAWIQPGQQPAYVMASPTLVAAQWRVYASGGSVQSAQQALTRAQLRLQEHERRIDMPDADVGNDNARNVANRTARMDRLWETVDDSDMSSDEDGDAQRLRPSRQSQRIARMQESDHEMDAAEPGGMTEEEQRVRQQMERERRLRRREMARTRGAQGVRQSNRVRVRNTLISESESESQSETSENVSLASEHMSEDAPGPSRPTQTRQGRTRKRGRNSDTPATEPREMRHYAWMLSEKRLQGLYVPQHGDEVVYIRKGHQYALEDSGDGDIPPWESLLGGEGIRPAEPCMVRSLKYFIARDDETLGTGVRLTLEFIDPGCPVKGQAFDLNLYSPISGFPDCVILRSLFDATAAYQWSAGAECQTMFWENDEEKWYRGTIQADTLSDFHAPDNPYEESDQLWERFEIEWQMDNGSVELSSHSPWELRSIDVDLGMYDEEKIEPSIVSRMIECIGEASKKNAWEIFQVAPLVSDCYQSRRLIPEFYNQIVALPIGLADISARLQGNYYRRISAIKDDMSLIAKNAAEFNGDDSDIVEDAKRLVQYLSSVLDGTADIADVEMFCQPSISSEDDQSSQEVSRPATRGQRRTRTTSSARPRGRPAERARTRNSTRRGYVSESEESDEELEQEESFAETSEEQASSAEYVSGGQQEDDEEEQEQHAINPRRTRIRLSNPRQTRSSRR